METLGKYTLLKKIATGGMAEIWVATTSVSGVQRVCVVKRILPHLAQNPEFVRMFLDEARLVATLTHPNVVHLQDVGEAGGSPFIAMEYLHGADVRAVKRALRDHRPTRMPLDHAVHIGTAAAAGLHYAHEKVGMDGRPLNIVHRDVSPQNLLVTYDGGVKVLDFGIAKSDAGKTETQSGTLKGKIPYMSPEQCACEVLDRRSDIYSLGVVLYELTTGHRVHPSGASEYEMMRAIVEGTVAPPSSVDPAFPPVLESILLKCLAKDRRRRYPTARDLQADLDAFAREERLAVSSLALSSYMGELFGKRAEAWREALAGGEAQLVKLAVTARGADDAGDKGAKKRPYGALLEGRVKADPVEAVPLSRSAPAEGPPSEALYGKRRLGPVTVIALSGRLDERFRGAAVAEALTGRVVLDLAAVTRVTSFGVREWLRMLGDAAPRAPEIFFARCPEPVVNQMSMIKGFADGGRVVSFQAPYRCDGCGATFPVLFDCERDADAVRGAAPKEAACPRCGGASVFDDDARSYFAFAAPHVGEPVPADVRATLDELSRAGAAGREDPIEKAIDGRVTRITVRAALDGPFRWKRVLDGIEGELEIDLGGLPGVTKQSAAALAQALRALGPEVVAVRVTACPRAVAERLLDAPRARAQILSITLEGRCDTCQTARTARIEIDEVRAAARAGRAPHAACKRCEAPLSFAGAAPFLRRLDDTPMSDPTSDEGRTGSASVTSSRTPGPPRARALFAAGALAAGGALAALLLWPRPRVVAAIPSAATAAPAPASAAASATPSAAPWSAEPLVVEADAVLAVGRGAGASEEAALAAAREDAIDRIAARLLDDLGTSPLGAFVRERGSARRADALGAVSARWLAQVGATSTPERVDAQIRREGGQVEAVARYRLRKDGYDAAAAYYRRSANLGGMTIAPVFPLLERTLRTRAAVVVVAIGKGAAASAGVVQGDAVLAVNGRAVTSVEAIEAAASAPGPIELRVEAGGAARTVTLGLR